MTNIEVVELIYPNAKFSYTDFSDCISVTANFDHTVYDAFDILFDLQAINKNFVIGRTLNNGQIFNLFKG